MKQQNKSVLLRIINATMSCSWRLCSTGIDRTSYPSQLAMTAAKILDQDCKHLTAERSEVRGDILLAPETIM